MNSRLAKILRKFFVLGLLSVAALAVSGVYAFNVNNVNLEHYWDSNNNKAWIGGDEDRLEFTVEVNTDEPTIEGVNIKFVKSGSTETPSVSCNINDNNDNDGKCEPGETCTVVCNINLGDLNHGDSYKLKVEFSKSDGNTDIYYWKTDGSSQELTNDESQATDIYVDKEAPTVAFDPNSKGWTNSDINVNIQVDDSESGVAELYYKIIKANETCPSKDSGEYSETTNNPETVTISNDGEWKICAYAVDNVGNSGDIVESGVYQLDMTAPELKIEQINLTHVKLIFNEEVRSDSNVEIRVSEIDVWDNGRINSGQNVIITCGQIKNEKEVICTIDEERSDINLLSKNVQVEITTGTITDRAGNQLNTGNIKIDAADIIFRIPANEWTYIAVEQEVDTSYKLYSDVINNIDVTILTYIDGKWKYEDPRHPLHPLKGYVIYIKDPSRDYYYLPVKYKEKLSNNKIELAEGWNLIAVIDGSIDYDTGIRDGRVDYTSLESLRIEYGRVDYMFIWIVDTIDGIYKSGRSKNDLDSWIREYRPYWIYLKEKTWYVALEPPRLSS